MLKVQTENKREIQACSFMEDSGIIFAMHEKTGACDGGRNMKLKSTIRRIESPAGRMKILILHPEKQEKPVPGILWIHGGGYVTGMASMVYLTAGSVLAKHFGAVLIAPEYRRAVRTPYPAAMEDCYTALEYLYSHAEELGVDRNRIVVGGESAGGGLAAAVCIRARDEGKIPVSCQIPLYPMLDCRDTESSRDNHGRIWNTKRNHFGWKRYLRLLDERGSVPGYASAAREKDLSGLPACYTFVLDGEPFYAETLDYVRRLKEAGVYAQADVYHGNVHAFDMMTPWTANARTARKKLCGAWRRIMEDSQDKR